ncbi:MAG: hypothetical protein JKY17_07805 [Magnetovibrio sp.]|nr:hypothetical protein [Magnetovibrio sp.]
MALLKAMLSEEDKTVTGGEVGTMVSLQAANPKVRSAAQALILKSLNMAVTQN